MGLRLFFREVYYYNYVMMKEVEVSEFLKGILRESIKEVVKEVKFYLGCLNVLNYINLLLYLIIVNWC